MMWTGAAAIRASVVELKCPRCAAVQARAHRRPERPIHCRACGEALGQAQGAALYRERKFSFSLSPRQSQGARRQDARDERK